ncbi:ubiquitin carboxyl-terminal hydrolase CYLD-like isoform X2 [Liolophura sinensis]|uniref:ubiquitin carboxyl-terminal hydrolase CYLD-like isoform X2 n=1 Tax=Liolophura sinensis TaxID=3198878 RepID=UPI0031581341
MRDGDFDEQFYILLCNTKGKRRERGIPRAYLSFGEKSTPINVIAGTLLVPSRGKQDLSKSLTHGQKFLLKSVESEGVEVECQAPDLKRLSLEEFKLLLPIPSCQDKLNVFLDGDGRNGWLKEGVELQIEDAVKVKLKGHSEDVLGVIRYKGPLPKESDFSVNFKGTHFGVELLYNPGEGTTDGKRGGVQLFECPADSGIFVTLNKIRRKNSAVTMATAGYGSAQGASLYPPTPPMQRSLKSAPIPECSLKINDRVVWISDTGPEHGVVKWIGYLPDSRRKEITVGVEFDYPVGSGTGKYKDTRLFYAKQNHASLVPILGLMKKEEFDSPAHVPPNINDTADLEAAEQQSLLDYHRKQHLVEQVFPADEIVRNMPTPHTPQRTMQCDSPNPLYQFTHSDRGIQNCGSSQSISRLPEPASSVDWPLKPPSMTEKPDPDPDLVVGSLVEVLGNPTVYGVIRWIGTVPDQKDPQKKIAGLEMEEEISAGTDGTFKNIRLFQCPMGRAFFVPLYKCRKDKRFVEQQRASEMTDSLTFGSLETPDIKDEVAPPSALDDVSFSKLCGKYRGIQGHHNSCYLDATLFAMFYFTTVFDSIFYRPRKEDDLPEYEEVQRVLKEGIVNPLRKNYYVRADKVMKLRSLLDKLSSVRGLLSEEKDPEEFLNSLLSQIMQADPFLKLRSGSDLSESYYYQLFMEQDDNLKLPTTQQLFELSFLQSDIKLAEAPSCLILQMPRFGKSYKMFKRIVPSLELDITDVLENAPRDCVICGDIAAFECKDCYKLHNTNLNTFCETCNHTNHKHCSRVNHKPKRIKVNEDFKNNYARLQQEGHEAIEMPRQKMELFAIVCIETSHYVSFVKAGNRWVFFDSMADRKGGEIGYNIPEVVEVRDLPKWLSQGGKKDIDSLHDDKDLPEPIRRLVCDAYMCIYQSPDIMRFK